MDETSTNSGNEPASPGGHTITGMYRGPHDRRRRAYALFVPARRTAARLPLVVMLHGCGQRVSALAAATCMNAAAAAAPFFVLYPEQARRVNPLGCWDWWAPGNQQRGGGEPALIAGLTRQILATYPIDAARVYVAGISAGGALAATMAATYPDLYAAVGVHSGVPYAAAHGMLEAWRAMRHGGSAPPLPATRPAAERGAIPARYVPLIVFQGDEDRVVEPANATALLQQWTKAYAVLTGCAPRAEARPGQVPGGRAYTRTVVRDGAGPTAAEYWLVHGAGHAWMGGSPGEAFTDPGAPDATAAMVAFFQAHPRSAPPEPRGGHRICTADPRRSRDVRYVSADADPPL